MSRSTPTRVLTTRCSVFGVPTGTGDCARIALCAAAAVSRCVGRSVDVGLDRQISRSWELSEPAMPARLVDIHRPASDYPNALQ